MYFIIAHHVVSCNYLLDSFTLLYWSEKDLWTHHPDILRLLEWTVSESCRSDRVGWIMPQYAAFSTWIFAGQLERKQVPHLSHPRDIRGLGRGCGVWRGGACERVRLGECVREALEATGYLSRYNGVSYEKTSVNFLSDLQQSITQSSHSAELWSRCLTESCHCSQPPTHRNSNFGLTNFPCNAIQLFFFSSSLFWAYETGELCIFKSKSKALAMCGSARGSRRAGQVILPSAAHPGCLNPALRGELSPSWWCIYRVTGCSPRRGTKICHYSSLDSMCPDI